MTRKGWLIGTPLRNGYLARLYSMLEAERLFVKSNSLHVCKLLEKTTQVL